MNDCAKEKIQSVLDKSLCVYQIRNFAPPHNRAEIVIPNEYQNTTSGDMFLLHDSGAGDQSRLFEFST